MQLLRKLAFPFSLLYGLGVYLRNLCYDLGILSSKAADTPTLSVGNLSVGGTGKTPMVELLVELLGPGRRLAVLSRGYKKETRGFLLATEESSARDIGDEPLQLKSRFPGLAVAVDADRRRGIARLEEQLAPDLILLDDAFQHRRVRPDISILLTDCGNLYTDDFFLPTGSLRDSSRSARRADLIVVTKCPEDLSRQDQENITGRLHPRAGQQVIFASLAYDPQLRGGRGGRTLGKLTGEPLTLVTGIARPAPLLQYLRTCGIDFEHMDFPDHHRFTSREMRRISSLPLVLTTEKDYRRMDDPPENLYYIRVRHKFLGNGLEVLKKRLESL